MSVTQSANDLEVDKKFGTADKLYDSENYQEAFRIFSLLASSGHTSSMLRLGVMYGAGIGVRQNWHSALFWEKKAADLGDVAAFANLGVTYRTIGNSREARVWFEKAMLCGDGDAAYDLARILDVSDFEKRKVTEVLDEILSGRLQCLADTTISAKKLLLEIDARDIHPVAIL
jgi:TPR repeat protein